MAKHQDSRGDGPRSTGVIRGRLTRRVAAPLAAAALLSAAGAGVAQAAQPVNAAAALPTCTASSLTASLHNPLAGGMNHQGVELQLKNTGTRTCALLGYPGLGLENAQHQVLTSQVTWGSTWYAKDPGKKVISLRPGQFAQAVIAWSHANIGTSGAVHAAYLEVTPPAATTHKTLAFPEWVDNGDLSVTSVAHSIATTD
ncbi:DUF4232 domain-containing protein [Actinopolymorpha pittospori]|uniref:DUF4232 domain-containing protein n=1 Tax=Actinopolymorpha pittospori TaxID=648752 RepID=A0A927MT58_9ACTN|nr:DUF4232 domain-containing protein [Actinopolymorpha pittospori]MBE1604363.1 hypothetical protein [Actinopolymorpha pittospori]